MRKLQAAALAAFALCGSLLLGARSRLQQRAPAGTSRHGRNRKVFRIAREVFQGEVGRRAGASYPFGAMPQGFSRVFWEFPVEATLGMQVSSPKFKLC